MEWNNPGRLQLTDLAERGERQAKELELSSTGYNLRCRWHSPHQKRSCSPKSTLVTGQLLPGQGVFHSPCILNAPDVRHRCGGSAFQ